MTSHLTFKAGCMPRLTQSLHPPLPSTNRTLAQVAFHAKQFVVILLTVGFPSINIEALRTNRSATMATYEMLGVERLANGLNTRL